MLCILCRSFYLSIGFSVIVFLLSAGTGDDEGLRHHWFGTERSEVQILSPRPNISTTYGCQPWRPYFVCGQFVDKILRAYISLKLHSANITHSSLQILVAHQRHYC